MTKATRVKITEQEKIDKAFEKFIVLMKPNCLFGKVFIGPGPEGKIMCKLIKKRKHIANQLLDNLEQELKDIANEYSSKKVCKVQLCGKWTSTTAKDQKGMKEYDELKKGNDVFNNK